MARKLVVQIIGDASSLERAYARAGLSSKQFGTSITRSTRRSLLAITGLNVGIVATGVKVSKMGSTYEDTMQRIVGLSGVAQRAVNRFSKEVLDLAPKVGRGPQELAEALYFITSSGIEASKAMDVLRASAKASVAGLGETGTVADAVTSAINAYGAANLSAQTATDVLVAAVRAGKGEADQLAGSIGNVTALAAQLGVQFNEVGAALASETRLGIDAETASIQLQQVFSNLLSVTPAAEKAFARVGLSSEELRKELGTQGLLATLTTIKEAFGDNLPELSAAFPNIRALRGLLALVGKDAENVRKVFADMTDTTGSLNTAFSAVSKDSAQQFRKMQAALEVTGITIGSALNPAILSVTKSLNEWLGKSKNQERLTRDIKDAVGILTDTLKTAKAVWDEFSGAVGGARNALKLLAGAFVLLKIRAAQTKATLIAAQLAEIGTQASLARAKVARLRGSLLGLASKAVTATIILEIIPHSTLGQNQLNKLGLGFLGKLPGVGGAATQLASIEHKIGGKIGIDESFAPASNAIVEKLKKLIVQGQLTAADIDVLEANGSISSFQADSLRGLLKARKSKRNHGKSKGGSSAASRAAAAAAKEAAKGLSLSLPDSVTGSGSAGPQSIPGVLAARAAKRQAAQFKALGLTGSGGERTPGVKALRNQLGSLADTVKGTFLDTDKTRGLLAHIRKVLSGGLGAIGRDVRQKIKEMLDDLNQQLKDHAGDQTAFRKTSTAKLLAGLGLEPEQIRVLRQRLATVGAGGTVPGGSSAAFAGAGAGGTVYTGDIHIHNVTDYREFENEMERRKKGRAKSRRGN